MNKTYSFEEQFSKGQKAEKILDTYFSQWYKIHPANRFWQKQGVDRFWENPAMGRVSVEYKADSTAAKSNNIFIEIISVDKDNKLGWAYHSIAQLLTYYIPPKKIIYLVSMYQIKKMLPIWKRRKYEIQPIPNKNRAGQIIYNTIGILVPIDDFVKDCKPKIMDLSGEFNKYAQR